MKVVQLRRERRRNWQAENATQRQAGKELLELLCCGGR